MCGLWDWVLPFAQYFNSMHTSRQPPKLHQQQTQANGSLAVMDTCHNGQYEEKVKRSLPETASGVSAKARRCSTRESNSHSAGHGHEHFNRPVDFDNEFPLCDTTAPCRTTCSVRHPHRPLPDRNHPLPHLNRRAAATLRPPHPAAAPPKSSRCPPTTPPEPSPPA